MKVGVIGCGGAGGNIADEASKAGFLTGAINFSQNDLDQANVRHKLRLSGSEGVGKNRELAIQLFNEQWELAVKWVQDHFSNVDAIFLSASSSGGSGSSILPILTDLLINIMPEKVIATLVIIPDLSEAPVSQQNCLHTFESLSKLDAPIFPIDNQQAKNMFSAKNKIFEYTNKQVIHHLKAVVDSTEKKSKNGNFDWRDFLTVLSTGGIASISEIDVATLEKSLPLSCGWVNEKIHESWSNGVFTPIGKEKVTRAAIIFDGQEGLLDFMDHKSIFSYFNRGMPIDLFEGIYHDNKGKIITLLTGLDWCNSRLAEIEKALEIRREDFESVLRENKEYQSKTGLDFVSKLRKQPEKKQSVLDILSRYSR